MKQYTILLLGLLLIPTFTFAVFNDVTLTTATILSVRGYTINVSGSSAVLESITVNPTNVSVTLSPGSSIQVSSTQQLTVDVTPFTISNTCTASGSVLTLASSGLSGIVTVTPQSTTCSGSSTGSGSVGNGPIVGSINPSVSQPTVSTTTATSTSTATSTPSTGGTSTSTPYTFTRNLSLHMTDVDVRALQRYLNSHGFLLALSGPGSPGNETTFFGPLLHKALVKFQTSVGLPGTGYFGPLTRGVVNK